MPRNSINDVGSNIRLHFGVGTANEWGLGGGRVGDTSVGCAEGAASAGMNGEESNEDELPPPPEGVVTAAMALAAC